MMRILLFLALAASTLACTQVPPGTTSLPLPEAKITLADPGRLTSITEYQYVSSAASADKSLRFSSMDVPVLWRQTDAFQYDAQQRLTQHLKTFPGGSWTKISYQYEGEQVSVSEQSSGGRLTTGRWSLNKQGYVMGDATTPPKPNEYVYDTDGFMVRYEGNDLLSTSLVEQGNVSTTTTTYRLGGTQQHDYTYDLTKAGVPSPLTYRGKSSRNLLVSQRLNDQGNTLFSYRYEFDAQGRAIRELLLRGGTSIERVREFNYQ